MSVSSERMRTSVHENGELSLILFGFFGRSTALITAWLQIRVCRYVSCWHIASFRCAAEFGRYRGIADIGQACTNRARFISTRPRIEQGLKQKTPPGIGRRFEERSAEVVDSDTTPKFGIFNSCSWGRGDRPCAAAPAIPASLSAVPADWDP